MMRFVFSLGIALTDIFRRQMLTLHSLYFIYILLLFTFCISLAPKKSEMSTVTGKIIVSKVEKKWKNRSAYLGRYDFHAFIKYEYEVDGKKYESDKIAYWNTRYNSSRKAENEIVLYPLGKEVTVYYKKENPQEAYLELEDDTTEENQE